MEEHTNLTKQERRLLRQQEKEVARKNTARTGLAKRMTVWTVVFVAIGAGIFGLTRLNSNPGAIQTATLSNVVSAADWIKGSAEAEVTIVEYSDFQCPACGTYYPIVKQLLNDYGAKIRFVYRHFPLKQIHQNAELAARAAETAGKQNKFWEMHDMIFERQRDWSNSWSAKKHFTDYAVALGLDKARFESDLESSFIRDKVDADAKSGLAAGVNATPTFFLNDKKMPQPKGLDDFKQQIDNAILLKNS